MLRRADHTLEALAVRRRLAWPLLALLLLLLAPAGGVAGTRTVTSLNDNGAGSLREAIGASVNGDTINFSVAGTITLTSGELLIGRSIAINGPTLASLTVSGNGASRVFNISSGISVNISNLTIIWGYSSGPGGGILNNGTLTVNNSTFSRNFADFGGGIDNELGNLNMLNTISANYTGFYDIDLSGRVTSQGHNLIGNADGSVGWVGSDLLGTAGSPLNPQLGPLQNNGGPTFTMALLPISAAIDAGDDAVLGPPYNLSTDQRGRARRTGDHVDIGAFEHGGITRLVTTLTDSGGGSLRGALALALDSDRILFAPVVRGKIRLTNGELVINKPLSIVGPGAAALAISGNTNSRVFHIGPQGNVDIYGLTITEGRVVAANGIGATASSLATPGGTAVGGGVLNDGILRIFDSMIVSNSVEGGRGGNGHSTPFGPPAYNAEKGGGAAGAGCYSSGLFGGLELHRCTLAGNRAVGGIGGVGSGLWTPGSSASGGGGQADGAGARAASASLESCTVAANLSTGGQGGIGTRYGSIAPYTYGPGGPGGVALGGGLGGGLALINCSVSGNSVTGGMGGTGSVAGAIGGTAAGGVSAFGPALIVQSTIIAGNTGSATSPDVLGAVASQGWNLIGITDGSSGWMLNDLLGNAVSPLNPLLSACQDNGGPVWTMGPLAGSPARDAGNSGLPTDARGGPRIVDFPNIPNAPGGDGSDIGALEVDSLFGAITIAFYAATIGTSGAAVVGFKSDPGTTYQLQQTSVVTNRVWTNIVGAVLTGNGQNLEAYDFGPFPTARFYRVRAD